MNKIKRNNKLSIIMLIIAFLMMFSSTLRGKVDRGMLYGGLFIFFGILEYQGRKSQKLGGSKLWLIVELPSVLIITLLFIAGLVKGFWYEYPLSFVLIPIIFYYYYIKSWKSKIVIQV